MRYQYRCPKCGSTDLHVSLANWYGVQQYEDGTVEPLALNYDLDPITNDDMFWCHHCEHVGPGETFKVPNGDPNGKCPQCGNVHKSCSECGRPTRCPPDEEGEAFSMCDECDAEHS